MRRRTGTLFALVATMLAALATRAWTQCAMCQSVVSQSPEARSAAEQLNLAILVMFFAPYVVLASLAFIVFPEPFKHFLLRVTGRARPR
jgi:L-asparagine transporter-like permease